MAPRIALVTDSSSQITPSIAARHQVRVVPVTVSIDDVDHAEGVDLTADDIYDRLAGGPVDVQTVQPSPQSFIDAFEAESEAGADHVLAVLVGADLSGTINSATLASGIVDVPVTIVDSGTASFGVTCAVLAAAEVIEAGGEIEDAAAAARRRAAAVESVFIVHADELVARSGRFDPLADEIDQTGDGMAVIWAGMGEMDVIDTVHTVEQAASVMADRVVAGGRPVVAAVGRAGPSTDAVTDRFRTLLSDHPLVTELLDYRVGPSIVAHTGPATAGGFFYPSD